MLTSSSAPKPSAINDESGDRILGAELPGGESPAVMTPWRPTFAGPSKVRSDSAACWLWLHLLDA